MGKLVALILFFSISSSFAQVVLVDPGHGGDDKGAEKIIQIKGRPQQVIYEKDLALSISKKIQEELIKKGLSAYLTRSLDRFITLQERADLANKLKADLFLSVHLNSDKSNGESAEGLETYYLDNHQDKAVRKVESVENKELGGEEKVVNQILIDLVIERTAPLSKEIAGLIHQNLKRGVVIPHHMKDRGVKPGLFYVLALSKRPAILMEVGFVSNSKEVALLTDDHFQSQVAQAVAQGVSNYFAKARAKKK